LSTNKFNLIRDRVAPASREALHEEIVTADVTARSLLRLTFLFSFRRMQNEYEIFTRYGE
jgi:hypothetical protein